MTHRKFAIFIVLASAVAAEAAEVCVRSSIVCKGSIVRLGDMAEVKADDAAIAKALAEVRLCPAPPAGEERTLTQHEIRQLLILSGIEGETITITGSERSLLSSESATVVGRRAPDAGTVRRASFIDDKADKDQLQSAPVTATTASLPPAAPPPLVERGASVTVRVRRPGIQITTSGKALQKGSAGDTISVELADSRATIQARVAGPQLVEIASGEGQETARR